MAGSASYFVFIILCTSFSVKKFIFWKICVFDGFLNDFFKDRSRKLHAIWSISPNLTSFEHFYQRLKQKLTKKYDKKPKFQKNKNFNTENRT